MGSLEGPASGQIHRTPPRILSRRELLSQAFRGAFAFTLLNRTVDTFGAPPDEAPKVTEARDEIGSKAIDVIEAASNLFLPESAFQHLPDKEQEARIEQFKLADPPDVRMLENETELKVGGKDPIFMTIKTEKGYEKIAMGYEMTPKGKQVLRIGLRCVEVKYLKLTHPAKDFVLRATVSKARKQQDGIANTGELKIRLLGTFTDTTVMPFKDLERNVTTLCTGTIKKGEILCPTMVEPRVFFYRFIGNQPVDTEDTEEDIEDEKKEIKQIYADMIKRDDDSPDSR